MQVPAVLAWMLFAAHTAAAGKGARVLAGIFFDLI